MLWLLQSLMLSLYPPTTSRRSCKAKDKPYKCTEPGCKRAFFQSQHLRRHEIQKHGRKKKFEKKDSISSLIMMYTEHGEESLVNEEAGYDEQQVFESMTSPLDCDSLLEEPESENSTEVKSEPNSIMDDSHVQDE